jgi:hypothetical protein
MYPCHYALLSPDRKPQACSRRQWLARSKGPQGPQYTPILAREQVHEWQVEINFTGVWMGEGSPKFFLVSVDSRNHLDDRQEEFASFEEARSALGHALEACCRWSEEEDLEQRGSVGT